MNLGAVARQSTVKTGCTRSWVPVSPVSRPIQAIWPWPWSLLTPLIRIQNGSDERLIKLDDFYLLPGDTPDRENQLQPGELITEVRVPKLPWARKSAYLKIRDRESYEFALSSAAVALDLDGDKIRDLRIAVGGVGTKPWNLPKVREALVGKPLSQETFAAAARLAIEGAAPLTQNGYKVDLVQRTIVRALKDLGEVA